MLNFLEQMSDEMAKAVADSPHLSMAVIAGCKMDFEVKEGKMVFKTKYPIKVTPQGNCEYLVQELTPEGLKNVIVKLI